MAAVGPGAVPLPPWERHPLMEPAQPPAASEGRARASPAAAASHAGPQRHRDAALKENSPWVLEATESPAAQSWATCLAKIPSEALGAHCEQEHELFRGGRGPYEGEIQAQTKQSDTFGPP